MNFKLYKLFAGLLCLTATIPANAFTIDEILADGNTAFEVITQSINSDCGPDRHNVTSFTKISDTQVKIENFDGHNYPMTLTLGVPSGSSYRESSDGTVLYYTYTSSDPHLLPGILQGFYGSGEAAYNFNKGTYWPLEIKQLEDGRFVLVSEDEMHIAYRAATSGNVSDTNIVHRAQYVFANSNSSGSHKLQQYVCQYDWYGQLYNVVKGSSKNITYDAFVDFDLTTNRLKIINFLAHGASEIHTCDKDAQSFVLNNYLNKADFSYDYVTGTINPEDNTLTIDPEQSAIIMPHYTGDWSGTHYNLPFYLKSTYYTGNTSYPAGFDENITGTYTIDDAPRHNGVEHAWVSNDGERRTFSGFSLEINEELAHTYMGPGINSSSQGYIPNGINWHNTYSNIKLDGSANVTCQVELTGLQGSNEDGIGCVGELKTTANPQYVDHYEIHVVPGAYSSINDPGFIHHLETGHQDAASIHAFSKGTTGVNLHTPVISVPATRSADDADATLRANDYSFVKFVPYSSLDADKAEALKNAKDLTYFVKTVYKPETNLAPTFHSMQTITKGNMTSIDSMLADSDSADATPEYYNLQGIRVLNPEAGQVYIRRTGTSVAKIRF